MISSHVKISMISVLPSFFLKLYLNSLVYHRNIFGSSSRVFGNLRKFSDIFGNFRKFSENVRGGSFGLRNNFENLRKCSENHQKRRHQYVYIIKRTLHVSFYVLVARTMSHSFPALTREILYLPLEHKIHIFSLPCNILYLLYENFDWKNFFFGNPFWKLVGHSYGPRYQKEKCSAWWKLNFSPQRCFLIALKSCRRSFRAILAHHVKENKVTLQTSTREGTSWAQCL